jgi:hypothetical protein
MAKPLDGQPRKRPRPCQICKHSERARIEALHLAGVSLDKLAAQFGVDRFAIHRHVHRHMSDEMKATYLVGPSRIAELAQVAVAENQSILDYLAVLRSILVAQLDRMATANDADGVAKISRPLLDVLKALGRVTGEINSLAASTIINVSHNTTILNSAPFTDLQAGLLRVCQAHPEARQDIVRLFRDLDAKYAPPAAAPPSQPVVIEARADG